MLEIDLVQQFLQKAFIWEGVVVLVPLFGVWR
jgi:hypothetical protein